MCAFPFPSLAENRTNIVTPTAKIRLMCFAFNFLSREQNPPPPPAHPLLPPHPLKSNPIAFDPLVSDKNRGRIYAPPHPLKSNPIALRSSHWSLLRTEDEYTSLWYPNPGSCRYEWVCVCVYLCMCMCVCVYVCARPRYHEM